MIRKGFKVLSLKAQKPSDEDIWNAAKEYAEGNSRAFYTEHYKAFRDGATECRDIISI